MGSVVKKIAPIAVALVSPPLAAALGLTGFAATAFGFTAQLATNALLGGGSKTGASGGGGAGAAGGLLVNNQGNTQAIDIVYGSRRLGGSRVYIDSTNATGASSGTEYLHMAFAVAQGGVYTDGRDAIKGITKIVFNDRVAWTSASGIDSYFSGILTVRLYYGSAGQVWNVPNVTAGSFAFSDHFDTGGHDGKGVVWAYITLKYNQDKYPAVPTILFEMDGKKLQPVNNIGTYSSDINEMRNPANVIYDYLTSERYGKGLDPSILDIASFQAARTYCNTAGLTVDGAVATSSSVFNNTQDLLAAANCNLVFSNGIYKLQPIKQESFVGAFEFNKDNIIGEWSISLGNKKTRFNNLRVQFFNPDLDWAADSIDLSDTPEAIAYLAEDGGIPNEKSIDLPFTSNKVLAKKVGLYYLKTSRYQTVVEFNATWQAMQLEVGDVVYVNHETPGWSGVNKKKFRVSSLALLPDSTVDVVLLEYAPDSIYLENN